MKTCPSCKGKRTTVAHLNFGYRDPRNGFRLTWCSTCKGHGEVTDDYEARRAEGRAKREARIAARESVRAYAKRVGIKPSEVYGIESPPGNDLPYPDREPEAEGSRP